MIYDDNKHMMMIMNFMMNLIINNLLIKHLMENLNLNYAYDNSTIKIDLLHQTFSDSMMNNNDSNVNDDQIRMLHRDTTIFTNIKLKEVDDAYTRVPVVTKILKVVFNNLSYQRYVMGYDYIDM